LTEQVNVSVEL